MSCPTCKCKTTPCGCEDQGLTTNTPCAQDTPECPNPSPCAETFSADCVVYTQDTILDLGILQGENLTRTLQRITLLFTNPTCILPNSPCLSVLNLHSTSIGSTTIKVAFDASSTAIGYIVEYKTSVAVSWTLNPVLPLSANPVDIIGGLVPNTDYDIRVSALCALGSCYSVTIRVKTKTV